MNIEKHLTLAERAYLAAIEGGPMPTDDSPACAVSLTNASELISQDLELAGRAASSDEFAGVDDFAEYLVHRCAHRLRVLEQIRARATERATRAMNEAAE